MKEGINMTCLQWVTALTLTEETSTQNLISPPAGAIIWT